MRRNEVSGHCHMKNREAKLQSPSSPSEMGSNRRRPKGCGHFRPQLRSLLLRYEADTIFASALLDAENGLATRARGVYEIGSNRMNTPSFFVMGIWAAIHFLLGARALREDLRAKDA